MSSKSSHVLPATDSDATESEVAEILASFSDPSDCDFSLGDASARDVSDSEAVIRQAADAKAVAGDAADSLAADLARDGGNLRVSLECPKCDHAGWVAWEKLGRVMHCPECQCHFQLGRLGKFELRDGSPVRYTCPRCSQSGELPAYVKVRGVECRACNLTLIVGPDGKLHAEPEVASLKKARRDLSHAARAAAQHAIAEIPWHYQPRKLILILLLLAVLSLGFIGWYSMSGNSPTARVASFTAECLAGDWRDALEYVINDPVQHAEFDRWRVRHFSSILDKHRPPGDRMQIQPELIEEAGEANTYRVVLRSPLIGKRDHRQVWRLSSGQWSFDVLATLALSQPARDQRSAESTTALPGHAPVPEKRVPKLPNNPYSRKR